MHSQGICGGFEAWVESEDEQERLNEYQVLHIPADTEHPARSQCYLETIDKPYAICVKKSSCLSYKGDWSCDISIDGVCLVDIGVWCEAETEYRVEDVINSIDGKLHKSFLKFSPQLTTDKPEEITLTTEDTQSLATIVISLTPGTWVRAGSEPCEPTALQAKVADEKAKKFAHTTSLVNPQELTCSVADAYSFEPSSNGESFYQFTFNYRSRVKLKMMNIIEEEEVKSPRGADRQSEVNVGSSGMNVLAKRKLSPLEYADAIDLTDSPPKKRKKPKLKDLLAAEAVEVEDEEAEQVKKECDKGQSSSKLGEKMKLLGEENQALREALRKLQQGMMVEAAAVDLTLDVYDSD
ncbi:uncharacterized protein L201_002820 [Kwoniella dendrophila CBS 6074]|uniref:DUF7918 domain-containing protein n=1 Tax=Kwoniella dendrophila CBS 6074 TaxID=1295534 RepID=A0AAX4JTM5_9TREE